MVRAVGWVGGGGEGGAWRGSGRIDRHILGYLGGCRRNYRFREARADDYEVCGEGFGLEIARVLRGVFRNHLRGRKNKLGLF